MKKERNKIPNNRLRQMRHLIIYNTNVQYCPGKYLYIADLLSRNYIQRVELTDDILNDVIHMINEVDFKNNRY